MFPNRLTQPQREATLDLLLLGIYADGAVRLAENARIYDLLSPFGWESYQNDQARTLYIDDLVVSKTQIGCP